MKPEIIAALRSDTYLQGRHQLRKLIGDQWHYDAYGVICDLYAREFPELANWDDDRFVFTRDDATLGWSTLLLPSPVALWAGFIVSNPKFSINIKYRDLRPEDEALTRNELIRAEAAGEKEGKVLIAKARARRNAWDSYKDEFFTGIETLGAMSDDLQMTFSQIADAMKQGPV